MVRVRYSHSMGGSRPLRRRCSRCPPAPRGPPPAARRAAGPPPCASGPSGADDDRRRAGGHARGGARRPGRGRQRLAAAADAGRPRLAADPSAPPHLGRPVASGAAAADGGFAIAWRPTAPGELTLRVVARGSPRPASVTAHAREATLSVVRAGASPRWYGPGFYGHHTACGETLTRYIVGVADRTLPCGTPVTLTLRRPDADAAGDRPRPLRQRRDARPHPARPRRSSASPRPSRSGCSRSAARRSRRRYWYPPGSAARPARPVRPARRAPPAAPRRRRS